jgi:hypothetical protein
MSVQYSDAMVTAAIQSFLDGTLDPKTAKLVWGHYKTGEDGKWLLYRFVSRGPWRMLHPGFDLRHLGERAAAIAYIERCFLGPNRVVFSVRRNKFGWRWEVRDPDRLSRFSLKGLPGAAQKGGVGSAVS